MLSLSGNHLTSQPLFVVAIQIATSRFGYRCVRRVRKSARLVKGRYELVSEKDLTA